MQLPASSSCFSSSLSLLSFSFSSLWLSSFLAFIVTTLLLSLIPSIDFCAVGGVPLLFSSKRKKKRCNIYLQFHEALHGKTLRNINTTGYLQRFTVYITANVFDSSYEQHAVSAHFFSLVVPYTADSPVIFCPAEEVVLLSGCAKKAW